ncbi:MAG: hypothetical protein ACO1O3_19605, partial [Sphingobium sp.]
MRSLSLKSLALAAAAVSLVALAGCAGKNAQKRADTNYVARDVNTLYNAGKDAQKRADTNYVARDVNTLDNAGNIVGVGRLLRVLARAPGQR